MQHKEIVEKFKNLFPRQAEYMTEWFTNGKNSIRVRLMYGRDYIFTYYAPHDWRFETIDCFIGGLKGEN